MNLDLEKLSDLPDTIQFSLAKTTISLLMEF